MKMSLMIPACVLALGGVLVFSGCSCPRQCTVAAGETWGNQRAGKDIVDLTSEEIEKLANEGNVEAQMVIGGRSYDDEEFDKALVWLQKAVDQGYAPAQWLLGCMYYKGNGVEKNDETARKLFQLAADQGHAYGRYFLGVLYYKGEAVEQNDKKAVELFRLAAAQEVPDAQNDLGYFYLNGICGLPQDYDEAFRLFMLSAEQEHVTAMVNLGVMYADGLGVPKDLVAAAAWLQKAADLGDEDAEAALEELEKAEEATEE